MGRKSRYTEYAKGMNKGTVAKNATTTKSKSILKSFDSCTLA